VYLKEYQKNVDKGKKRGGEKEEKQKLEILFFSKKNYFHAKMLS